VVRRRSSGPVLPRFPRFLFLFHGLDACRPGSLGCFDGFRCVVLLFHDLPDMRCPCGFRFLAAALRAWRASASRFFCMASREFGISLPCFAGVTGHVEVEPYGGSAAVTLVCFLVAGRLLLSRPFFERCVV